MNIFIAKLAVLRQNLLPGQVAPQRATGTRRIELVGHLGRVEAHGGEEFAFVVGAHRELFKRPHGQDLGIDEVSRLRKFLKAADAESAAAEHTQNSTTVVVIDHHSAHLYRDGLPPPADGEDVEIKPYDPHHFHHHLIHRKEAHYEGDRVPEESSFYREIAQAHSSPPGTLSSSAMESAKAAPWMRAVEVIWKAHHPDLARRVKGVEVVDLSALTEPQIEAIVGGAR